MNAKLHVRVAEVEALNPLIKRFRFVPCDGGLLPAFSCGAHVVVEMEDHGTRRMNPSSLSSDPEDRTGYEVTVRRDDAGRGGSLYMHSHVTPGMEMVISHPVNLFPLDGRAKKHLFLAGGIGITPFKAMIHQLGHIGGRWELHYASRNPGLCAYGDQLTGPVQFYYDDDKSFIPLRELLSRQPLGTHVYCCGPKGMLAWVRATAAELGLAEHAVHFEDFTAPQPGAPFDVDLLRSGLRIHVAANQSLLEAMEAAGVDAPYLCRGGACGQCECDVVTLDGQIDHRDHWLAPSDHKTKIMPCVSRFTGRALAIDR